MRLGDMQSVLQISVALNLAYFSFREIRTPALKQYDRAMRQTDETIARALALYRSVPKPEKILPGSEETSAWMTADVEAQKLNLHIWNQRRSQAPYSENMYSYDKAVSYAALVVGAIAFVLLVLCTAFAGEAIRIRYFLGVTGICLLPTMMAVAYSWLIAGMVEKEIGIVKDRALAVEQEMQRLTEKVPRKYFSAPAL
ncbi:hypothetical protein Rleg10DRAFT_5388 [Rhizobium leguminosarum bv. trifolii WSM2012]|nr:hypothetical protein Rleg10DRAFT_5388 [Rhizobium leguminosarum bv. trifolii WSM2012]